MNLVPALAVREPVATGPPSPSHLSQIPTVLPLLGLKQGRKGQHGGDLRHVAEEPLCEVTERVADLANHEVRVHHSFRPIPTDKAVDDRA